MPFLWFACRPRERPLLPALRGSDPTRHHVLHLRWGDRNRQPLLSPLRCGSRPDCSPAGSTCLQQTHINAAISGNQMTGEFGIYSSYAGTSGTITFNFTAVPKR